MNIDQKLLETSYDLLKAMDKTADACLPKEIADVVKLHSKLALASAWIPVPGADVAAAAATIWGMYIRINKKIGVPFGENIMKSIGSGVATNLASYIAMSGVASTIKFIPGIGTIGGAVLMSASIYALTLAAGWVYLRALCYVAQKKGANFNATDVSNAVNEFLKNKSMIKEFINSAKNHTRLRHIKLVNTAITSFSLYVIAVHNFLKYTKNNTTTIPLKKKSILKVYT